MAEEKKKKGSGVFEGPDNADRTTVVDLNARPGGLPAANRMIPVLLISSGTDQGKIIVIEKSSKVTMGRSRDCTITVPEPSASRNHAEVYSTSDNSVFIKDLGSTNGTTLNGEKVRDTQLLSDGDRIQIGDNSIIRFSILPEEDARSQEEVYQRATRDALTGAYNRRQFEEVLSREISLQGRGSTSGIGVIIFDVDFFKKVNDSFGHLAGDEVLRSIGQRIPKLIRTEDVFARIGGEEFALLLRIESGNGVQVLCERVRQVMEKEPSEFEGRGIPFTVSVGGTFSTNKAHTPEHFIQMADEALYESKRTGRNKVTYKPC